MLTRLRSAGLLVAAMLCATAAWREIVVWRSDCVAHKAPERLREALDITPHDAAKWRQLGILLLKKAPADAGTAFQRAVELNPFDADSLVGLAYHAEAEGDIAAAESFYLRALQSSRRFKHSYAAAAFYARSGKDAEFWKMASSAAAIEKADVRRILRLAAEIGANPDDIPDLLNLRTEGALAAYLQMALEANRVKPIAYTAMRLPITPTFQPVLLLACDRLIQAGAAGPAVALWNRLGLFEQLDVPAGRSLTNAALSYSPVSGFNWRMPALTGIQMRPAVTGLRIELTGSQPEHAVVLEQTMPVLPERSYRFAINSTSSELSSVDGLSWQLQCVKPQTLLGAASVSKSSTTTSLDIAVPHGCGLIRSALVYTRKPGTVRISGTLDLLSSELELVR